MLKTIRSFIVFIVVTLVAQAGFGQVIITPKNADGLYRAGEKAVWTVKPGPQSATTAVDYTIHKNGGTAQLNKGTLDLSSGSATVEIGLDEPGQIVLEVSPQKKATEAGSDEATPSKASPGPGRFGFGGFGGGTRDGAIIDAEHIKPMLARPDDFDAWWEKKLDLLHAIPANAKLDKVDVNIPDIEYYKITLENINDTQVHGQLAKPAKEGKFPAILQLQYAGVYPLQRQWVTDLARKGWLALNVVAHDMPIDDQAEIQKLARGPLSNYQSIGNTDRETCYFLRMYLGDCRALEYLASRPDWDGKTLVVMGDSMGGQQSFATVGLVGDKLKVTHMLCHVPSGSDAGARDGGRTIAYPNWPNQPEVIQTARYFDAANFAPRIKATSLVSVGLYDGISPPTGVIATFNLLTGPKELLTLHADHMEIAGNHQPRAVRRGEWFSALLKGEPVPLKDNSGK